MRGTCTGVVAYLLYIADEGDLYRVVPYLLYIADEGDLYRSGAIFIVHSG